MLMSVAIVLGAVGLLMVLVAALMPIAVMSAGRAERWFDRGLFVVILSLILWTIWAMQEFFIAASGVLHGT